MGANAVDWRVGKLLSIVEKGDFQKDEAWLLAEAAKALNLSCSRLRHVFKVETGISVGQFVRFIRLRRARELLETTTLSVKEVMVAVGFNDKSYFTRKFEQEFGVSPSVYRSRSALGKVIEGNSQIMRLLQAAIQENPHQESSIEAKLSNK